MPPSRRIASCGSCLEIALAAARKVCNHFFMQKIFSVLALLVVAVSAAFILMRPQEVESDPATFEGKLKAALPTNPDGWTSQDHELGETDEVRRSAEKILNVTDFLNRSYTKNGKEFTVFVSYWKPNTMEIYRTVVHRPDRCWVVNGWTNVADRKKKFDSFEVDGQLLRGGYSRFFTILTEQGKLSRYVMYWHFVDGKLYSYNDESISYFSNWVKEIFESIREGRPEQLFIRIDSSSDFKDLMRDKGFKQVLKSLGKLALDEK